MNEALGLLETFGLTPTLVALDRIDKTGRVRLVECELNDLGGVATKITGPVAAVAAALEAGRAVADAMGGRPVVQVIAHPDAQAWRAIQSPRTYNPLIEQDVVFHPNYEAVSGAAKGLSMSQESNLALGIIETQGFTAVFEAIDTACKAANVEVVGKEKLGGGYIAVIVRGELSAVTAAIEAGRGRAEALGKLIAAHVLARPSASVLALLPK